MPIDFTPYNPTPEELERHKKMESNQNELIQSLNDFDLQSNPPYAIKDEDHRKFEDSLIDFYDLGKPSKADNQTDQEYIPDMSSQEVIEQQALEDTSFIGTFLEGSKNLGKGILRGPGYTSEEFARSIADFMNAWDLPGQDEARAIQKWSKSFRDAEVLDTGESGAGHFGEHMAHFLSAWGAWAAALRFVPGLGIPVTMGATLGRALPYLGATGKFIANRNWRNIGKNFFAASMAGGTGYNPADYEKTLTANFAKTLTELDSIPSMNNAITRFFVSKPGDSSAMKRLQGALSEGVGMLGLDLTVVPAMEAGIRKVSQSSIGQRLGHAINMQRLAAHSKLERELLASGKQMPDTHVVKYSGTSGDLGDGTYYVMDKNGQTNFYRRSEPIVDPKTGLHKPDEIPVYETMHENPAFSKVFSVGPREINFTTPAAEILLPEKASMKQISDFRSTQLGPALDAAPTSAAKIGLIKELARRTERAVMRSKKRGEPRPGESTKSGLKRQNIIRTSGVLDKEAQKSFEEMKKDALLHMEKMGFDVSKVTRGFKEDRILTDSQFIWLNAAHREIYNRVGALALEQERILLSGAGIKQRLSNAFSPEIKQMDAEIRFLAAQAGEISDVLEVSATNWGRSGRLQQEYSKIKQAHDRVASDLNPDLLTPEALSKVLGENSNKFSYRGNVDPLKLAQMIRLAGEQGGPSGLRRFLQEGTRSSFGDVFLEYWINHGLLSGGSTLGLQIATNTFTTISNIPITFLAGAIGTAKRGISKLPGLSGVSNHNDPVFTEFFGSIMGLFAGVWKGLYLAPKAMVKGESVFGKQTRWDYAPTKAVSAEGLGYEGTAMGLGFNLLGMMNRMPGNNILTVDEFYKSISYEIAKWSGAWRYAVNNSKGAGFKNRLKIFHNLLHEATSNPSKFHNTIGKSIDMEAVDIALLDTMQRELGTIGKSMQRIAHENKALRLPVPFIKVLANIPKYHVRHSPAGLAFQSKEFREGGAKRTMEYARMAYGTLITAAGVQLANKGGIDIPFVGNTKELTGWDVRPTGSGDPNWRRQMQRKEAGLAETGGAVQFTHVSGKQFIATFDRVSPAYQMFTSWNDIRKLINQNHADDDINISTDSAAKSVHMFQNYFVNPTYGPSLNNFLGIMNMPVAKGDDRWYALAGKWLSQMGATIIPAWMRQMSRKEGLAKPSLRAYDFQFADDEKGRYQSFDRIHKAIEAVIPSTGNKQVMYTPHIWNYKGDMVRWGKRADPLGFLEVKDTSKDPLDHEISRIGLEIGYPSARINVEGYSFKLLPHQYEEYTRLIGNIRDGSGRLLHESMRDAIGTDVYKNAPRGMLGKNNDKQEILMGIYNAYEKAAQRATVHEFNLTRQSLAVQQYFQNRVKDLK